MEKWQGRVALVTGASKGIGASVAALLVQHGMKVVACARNIDPIQQAAQNLANQPGELHAIRCDLREEHQILTMFDEIAKLYGGIDVLINNCGLPSNCSILTADTETMRLTADVNILAPSICSREAVKSMRQRGIDDGHIVNINSSSGQRVSSKACLHFYSATKFALKALTVGLRQELKQIKSHIRVTSIYPGVTDTPALTELHTPAEREALLEKLGGIMMKAEDVGDSVIYALSAPPHVQIEDLVVRPMFHA